MRIRHIRLAAHLRTATFVGDMHTNILIFIWYMISCMSYVYTFDRGICLAMYAERICRAGLQLW